MKSVEHIHFMCLYHNECYSKWRFNFKYVMVIRHFEANSAVFLIRNTTLLQYLLGNS